MVTPACGAAPSSAATEPGSPPPAPPWEVRLTWLALFFGVGLRVVEAVARPSFGLAQISLLSLLQDSACLLLAYAVCIGGISSFPRRQIAGRVAFGFSVLLLLSVAWLYGAFFHELINFPLNLFGVSRGAISFFWREWLTAPRKAGLVIIPLLILLLSLRFPRRPLFGLSRAARIGIWSCLFLGGVLSLGLRPVHPVLFSLGAEWQARLGGHTAADIAPLSIRQPPTVGRCPIPMRGFASPDYPQLPLKYDRVAVFVMESIRSDDFTLTPEELDALFPVASAGHWRVFSQYHCLNLDSFPSLLAMTHSRFVPFQAYVDGDRYRFLNPRPNLIGFFNANGVSTQFITSFYPHQIRFVPDPSAWQGTTFSRPGEHDSRFARIDSNPVESAQEDLAVLEPALDLPQRHPRVFLFQEMVYGHTPELDRLVGKTAVTYYRDYLRAFFQGLSDRGLLENTLVVCCADHGPRDDPMDPRNYHIPLVMWAADLKPGVDSRFLSHLDFKDILLEALTDSATATGTAPAFPQSDLLVVGHSGEYTYGRLSASGTALFINNRTLTVHGSAPPTEAPEVNRLFQAYLSWFVGSSPQSGAGGDDSSTRKGLPPGPR